MLPTLYNGCNYSSMLELKLIYVFRMGRRPTCCCASVFVFEIETTIYCLNLIMILSEIVVSATNSILGIVPDISYLTKKRAPCCPSKLTNKGLRVKFLKTKFIKIKLIESNFTSRILWSRTKFAVCSVSFYRKSLIVFKRYAWALYVTRYEHIYPNAVVIMPYFVVGPL